jgi:ankyrin repeat protein
LQPNIAAERWDVAMVELLVSYGADIHQHRSDGRTAYAIATLHGNSEIAAWLLRHGARDELSMLDRFIAACASGDRARAVAMLAENPALRNELRTEHHLLMHVPAERGDSKVLATMLECGFDPNVKDSNGVTTLHRAAIAGRADAVRVLLDHGAFVNALDGMFAGTPLLWACEGWSHDPRQAGMDHVAAARLLLAAGSQREWLPPEKAPDPEGTQERLMELCRAADAG